MDNNETLNELICHCLLQFTHHLINRDVYLLWHDVCPLIDVGGINTYPLISLSFLRAIFVIILICWVKELPGILGEREGEDNTITITHLRSNIRYVYSLILFKSDLKTTTESSL